MDNNTLEQKQNFLRKEILEAGYDGGQFMEFLNNLNHSKGSDLDHWTLKELNNVVEAFIKSKKPPKQEQISRNTVEKSFTGSQKNENKNILDDTIFCQKIKSDIKQPSSIFNKEEMIEIKVTKFQKIQGGMFERSFVTYTIEIPYLKTAVNRRYSEFAWLKDTLSLLYPGYPIPPVAKKSKVARYQDKYLTKKMFILQKFLNCLIKVPELYSQILVEKFLTIADPKQFQKFKSLYNKIGKVPIRKIKTLEGVVNVTTQKRVIDKLTKYDQYLKDTQPEMKKIYKNFKGAATNLEIASQFLKSIGQNCKILRKKQELIRSDFQLPPIQQTSSTLLMLQTFANQYANSLISHAKVFRKQIYSLAKYESLYKINMSQSFDLLRAKQQEYNDAKLNLNKKKDKLYLEGKVSKWGIKEQPKPSTKEECYAIMLPKQTGDLLELREVYGLYNAQLFQECYRHTHFFNRNTSKYIQQFIQLQARIFSQASLAANTLFNKTSEIVNNKT